MAPVLIFDNGLQLFGRHSRIYAKLRAEGKTHDEAYAAVLRARENPLKPWHTRPTAPSGLSVPEAQAGNEPLMERPGWWRMFRKWMGF